MRKLRELTTRYSLAELVEAWASEIVDGETAPEAVPEGEKKFVKLHKTEKHAEPYGNKKASDGVKKDTSKAGKEPLPGFPPEVKEEEQIDESGAIGRSKAKSAYPLIKRPKFDARGNVVLTKDAKANIEYGKKPRSRKLTGTPYSGKKRFGEEKELDEGDPIETSGRRSKTRQARQKAGPNFPKKKNTVLVTNKGSSEALRGGGVRRIPKSKYNPNVHNLAEDQIDEKWGVKDAVNPAEKGKYAGWSLKQLHSALGKPGADKKELNFAIRAKTGWGKVSEEKIDELKKETLARYISGRTSHLAGAAYSAGAAGATNQPREAGAQTKKLHKYQTGIKRAAERVGGTYETGKPLKVMIPGKGDKDPGSGPYTMKRKKLYHGEEAEINEGLKPRKLAPQEWRIGCMSEFDERKDVQLIEEDTELQEGGPTKKHFQMAADTIKAISDEGKRKEHATTHADLYSKQNPRFDRGKFLKACGVNEETDKDRYLNKSYKHSRDAEKKRQLRGDMKSNNEYYRDKIYKARKAQLAKEENQLDEVITKSTPVGDVIHDFVHSKNKVFSGDSKKQRIKRALGAYYGKQRGE